jgi:branched-chain amino acid aminotransferase
MSWDAAKPTTPALPISALDRPAVFETMRVYAGQVAGLALHADRLRASARTLGFPVPSSRLITLRVLEAVKKSGFREAMARFSVQSIGTGAKSDNFGMFCVVRGFAGCPESWYRSGVRLMTSSVHKAGSAVSPAQVKGNDYSNALAALVTGARADGSSGAAISRNQLPMADLLLLNAFGTAAETTVSNILMIRDRVLWTPPAPCGILLGVTRKVVLESARTAGLEVREAPVTRHDLFNAEEVFLTNSAVEVLPVVELDARRIGNGRPGPRAAQLRELYRARVMKK